MQHCWLCFLSINTSTILLHPRNFSFGVLSLPYSVSKNYPSPLSDSGTDDFIMSEMLPVSLYTSTPKTHMFKAIIIDSITVLFKAFLKFNAALIFDLSLLLFT